MMKTAPETIDATPGVPAAEKNELWAQCSEATMVSKRFRRLPQTKGFLKMSLEFQSPSNMRFLENVARNK